MKTKATAGQQVTSSQAGGRATLLVLPILKKRRKKKKKQQLHHCTTSVGDGKRSPFCRRVPLWFLRFYFAFPLLMISTLFLFPYFPLASAREAKINSECNTSPHSPSEIKESSFSLTIKKAITIVISNRRRFCINLKSDLR